MLLRCLSTSPAGPGAPNVEPSYNHGFMLVGRRLVVSGRVQGVGFRHFVREAARAEGLQGWVQNLDDGRVEVHAEGDLEAMDRFERHLRQGPVGARVLDVAVDTLSAASTCIDFRILP